MSDTELSWQNKHNKITGVTTEKFSMKLYKLGVFALVLSVRGHNSTGPVDFPDESLHESLLETAFDFSTCGSIATYQSDYRGDISVTENGHTCQKWTERTVHNHEFSAKKYPGKGLGAHNHCRNPDLSPAPWCFTEEEDVRWERCDVPRCEKTLNWKMIREKRKVLKKEAQHAKAEFDTYFDDVRDLNNLCERFAMDYETKTCEKDFLGGWRRKGGKGFEDEEKELKMESDEDNQKQLGWLPLTKNIRGSTAGITNYEAERLTSEPTHEIDPKDMCLIYPTPYAGTADALFEKKIRILVGDPDWKSTDFRHAQSAMNEFKTCTQGMMYYTMKSYHFTIDEVNVSKKNWMTATYEVLLAAKEKGIKVHGEQKHIKNKGKVFTSFNMKEWITMVILPDDVDFEGAYGFSILHNGLVVIKSSEAKNPTSILHELGHSLGMRHSSSPNGTYGDDRCIMGNAKDEHVCFNGPKSIYLGLYREFTGAVNPLEQECEVLVTIADVQTHLSKEENIFEKWGRYYVIVEVPYEDSDTSLHLMYYGDDDNQFLAATEGSIETLYDTRAHHVSVASTSQRIFDLKVGETKIHKGLLYKLCGTVDKKIAKVMMTYNVNAALTCPSKNPFKAPTKKDPVLNVRSVVGSWYNNRKSTEAIYGPISKWDTSKATSLHKAFYKRTTFNEDISRWDVSKVTDTSYMFREAAVFNQDLSRWDMSKVTNMQYMFYAARNFNQDISRWDVSQVTTFMCSFRFASSFNQDVSQWDVSKVQSTYLMFDNASRFNQRLCWDISHVREKRFMFWHTKGSRIGCPKK